MAKMTTKWAVPKYNVSLGRMLTALDSFLSTPVDGGGRKTALMVLTLFWPSIGFIPGQLRLILGAEWREDWQSSEGQRLGKNTTEAWNSYLRSCHLNWCGLSIWTVCVLCCFRSLQKNSWLVRILCSSQWFTVREHIVDLQGFLTVREGT